MGIVEMMKVIDVMVVKWLKVCGIYIEDKVNGMVVIEMFKNELSGIIVVNLEGGKEVWVNVVVFIWEVGNVYFLYLLVCFWVDDFINELVVFLNVEYDDDVDSMI